jgi:hypothetical protein
MTQRYRFSAYLGKTHAKVMIPAGTYSERESFLVLRRFISSNPLFTGAGLESKSRRSVGRIPGCVNMRVRTHRHARRAFACLSRREFRPDPVRRCLDWTMKKGQPFRIDPLSKLENQVVIPLAVLGFASFRTIRPRGQ